MNSERTNDGMQSISSSLAPLAKKLFGKNGFVELDIITNWEAIIGKSIAEFVHPQSIEFKRGQKTGGTLFVCVDSGAFAAEISHKQQFIIEKINTYFGYGAVEKIKIMQAQSPETDIKKQTPLTGNKKTLVTLKEQNYIDSQTAGIKDENLRHALQELGNNIFMQEEKK